MAVPTSVKGIVFAIALFLACFLGTLVMLLPCIPVALKWPPVGRRMMDTFLWLWFVFAAAMYELFLGVKVVVLGHIPLPGQSVLILCNHRTRLDWLFLVSYQLRCGTLQQYRISLKKPLKYLPGPGWAMQCAGFLFLQREWRIDKDWISQALRYFAQMGTKPQFLLFPEGTDFCESGLAKSQKFAQANNLPVYKYVLHPRTTGFIHFVNQMKHNQILDAVVDLTVAYPQNIVHGENELVHGRAPREVHFLACTYPISHLPQSEEKLEAWCRNLWHEKEQRLERFYSTATGEGKMFHSLDGENKSILSEAVPAEVERRVRQLLWCMVGFWALFLSGVVWALVWYPLFRWYCLLSALTFVFIGKSYGGVDNLLYATCT